ncbi:MAG TPA: tetratricopeptide repeat protein [bacterium]
MKRLNPSALNRIRSAAADSGVRAILILALLMPALSHASWRGQVRAGDKAYEKQKYDEALVKYLEALGAKGDSTLIKFDLGNVYQVQEKFGEAGQAFQNSLQSPDSLTRANALYNIGNALFGDQKYAEAAQAYKSALKMHPDQKDYLHNLELALRLMKRPPQQQQNQQQNQDQKDQQKKQDQQKQQGQDQQQQQQQDQQNQQQQMAAGQMSKEDAERLLNALQRDEKQVQENLRKQQGVETGVEKDW